RSVAVEYPADETQHIASTQRSLFCDVEGSSNTSSKPLRNDARRSRATRRHVFNDTHFNRVHCIDLHSLLNKVLYEGRNVNRKHEFS
ncbi:MAG TPA: hypothetical protein VIM69_11015, partial [Opitutaceae bacterium]